MDELATFYMINATSLVKHAALQQLATELTRLNFGNAVITETRFNSHHLDCFANIDGYLVFRIKTVLKLLLESSL